MSRPFTIRPRTPTDLPGCVDLLRAVYAVDKYPVQGPDAGEEFLTSPQTVRSWVAIVSHQSSASAHQPPPGEKNENATLETDSADKDEIIGHISLSLPPATSSDPAVVLWRSQNSSSEAKVAVLERLFTHPSSRGLGVGRALMETVVKYAWGELKGTRVVLFALEKDQGAMRAYEKAGWQEFGKRAYGYTDEEGREREMGAVCFVGPDGEVC